MTTPICAGCGKRISGRYIRALGRSWHTACFRCAGCGRPIGEQRFLEHGGRPYHSQCYHERFSPRCAACGQPIIGQRIEALGKQWHPEHFVCAHCHKPFAGNSFYERDGRAYCEYDYHQLFSPRCAICGQPMRGTYLTNAWGESFCQHHTEQYPKCFSCGRLISSRLTDGGVRYGDGRTVCNLCRRTAIDHNRQGQRILAQVQRGLARLGLDIDRFEFPLRLTDQQELNRLSTHRYNKQPTGMARTRLTTRNGQVIGRHVEEILVLHDLPLEHAAGVMAHELGHAWLFLHAFPQLPPMVEEGLCNLCEYLWLRWRRGPEAEYHQRLLEENTDPIYGDGFRAARRALQSRTLPQLLTYVQQHRRFPR
ncbi:MAG TPA: protein DA1 [Anaerolineae bacterium]|nr:protein DA1 [Anaerolineae bacterium]